MRSIASFLFTAALTTLPLPAAQIYFSDLETDDGGWTESGFGEWERGTITFTDAGCDNPGTQGPAGAYSGSNAWGTTLNTCYANSNATSSLSQSFDLTSYTAATFSWYQWEHVFATFDHARLFANGDLLYDRASSVATADWEQRSVDLTPYVGGVITLRFDLFATTVVNRAGWYLDNLSLDATPADTAVPEPASFLLIAPALALFYVRRK